MSVSLFLLPHFKQQRFCVGTSFANPLTVSLLVTGSTLAFPQSRGLTVTLAVCPHRTEVRTSSQGEHLPSVQSRFSTKPPAASLGTRDGVLGGRLVMGGNQWKEAAQWLGCESYLWHLLGIQALPPFFFFLL